MTAPRNNQRAERIASQMQRVIADLLRRGVKDPRIGNVTVTAVTLAPDLSVAQVYFLPFGTRHAPPEILAGLRSAAGYLRGTVARELELRHAPRLEFALDTTIERAAHLSGLIDSAVQEDRERATTGEAASNEPDEDGAAPRG